MHDLTIHLDNRPGTLAAMGEALGGAGISIEGGGVFVVDGRAVAHFLFHDGAAARSVLEEAGFPVEGCRTPLVQRLDQETPGQLGRITRLMADAGVNIETMYSDHDNRLILVVDDQETGSRVSDAWTSGGPARTSP
ncbi:amino acid-binding protein [Sphaerisporangium melleum]|uniref:Amino acid-binding protein n=1 Tax=Sphaerisporangium melleum TaxID=321316 RepID=A0A917RBN5_9ACTN|nr:amino acid-binding ACT domain-containing protein [Sphaerisporangium melleum]GGK98321.1 amino acid-binding protein [Sphaerisporangium melleum]GII73727.1 amino acid-binding protein [Sphaerisporangium melleum]